MKKTKFFPWLCALFFALTAHADIGTEEFLRQQERQRNLQEQAGQGNGRQKLGIPGLPASRQLPAGEFPCFPVRAVELEGEYAGEFRGALDRALAEAGFSTGHCLGARGLEQIILAAQDKILAGGWITTRIMAPEQDLRSGKARLLLLPGKIRLIRFDGVGDPKDWQGKAAKTQFFRNEFPMQEGSLLQLRELETALENLRRLASVEADFEVRPTERADASDIVVHWRQGRPLRMVLSLDDSGSKWTGKNQGTLAFSLENPMGFSESLNAWHSRDLGHKKNLSDRETGKRLHSGTKSYGFGYSIPFGFWALAYDFSHSEYRQAVAGAFVDYLYSGWSEEQRLSLSRVLHRDGVRKTSAGIGIWMRKSRNFIDGTELRIQRRRAAGWQAEAAHLEYFRAATLRAELKHKRGTGAHRALAAPEEAFGEGTSRMALTTLGLSAGLPFSILGEGFAWSSRVHGQWNRGPLLPQDRFSIGSRWTVRGFDGENTLMAERGWWLRNEFSWQAAAGIQPYLLHDQGAVRGQSARWLPGKRLAGYGAGLRGLWGSAARRFSYDFFVARPAKAPRGFAARRHVLGMAANASF
jgi:hemolysin activation/secretion protein